MTQFRDKNGREWSIDLTIGAVERVKRASRDAGREFDLYDPGGRFGEDGKKLQAVLWSDHSAFWELLWHLCEPQATAAGVTAEQFGDLMAARCLLDARRALWREWEDFFRQLQRPGEILVLERLRRYETKAVELAMESLTDPRLEEVDREVEQRMRTVAKDGMDRAFSDGLGKLRAS